MEETACEYIVVSFILFPPASCIAEPVFLGVPYIARKMMVMSSPVLDVSQEGDKWSIKSSTLLRTVESLFVPNEPYEETLPSGDILKSTSTLADNKIVTSSEVPNGSRTTRSYEFSEGGCVLSSASSVHCRSCSLFLTVVQGAALAVDSTADGGENQQTLSHDESGKVAKRYFTRVE
uniref:Uncharacterized protein n=1 Tax=Timema douglasi TaxID=61478 RepID=A0A7R8VUS8_TIMDO|nr:unnamed protein product [Timema douglasi]